MKKTLITIGLFSILIGVFAVALNLAFGYQTSTLITKIQQDSGIYMYKFDFANYIKNINLAMTETTYLTLTKPDGEWINNAQSSIISSEYWEITWNNFKLALNWLLFIINILIYPFRVGSYITKNYLAIIGINTNANNPQNGLAWLINLTNYMIQIEIPYIS